MTYLEKPVREYMQSMGFTEYDKTTDAFYKARPTYAEGGVGGKWSIDRDVAEQLFLTQQTAVLEARIETANHLHRNMSGGETRDFDNDTDEYICTEYVPTLEEQIKKLKEQQ